MLTKSSRCPEYDGKSPLLPIVQLFAQYAKAHSKPEQTAAILRWRDANYTRFTDALVGRLSVLLSPPAVQKLHEFISIMSLNYGEEHIIVHRHKQVYVGQSRRIVTPSGKTRSRQSFAKQHAGGDDYTPDYKSNHEQYVLHPRLTSL